MKQVIQEKLMVTELIPILRALCGARNSNDMFVSVCCRCLTLANVSGSVCRWNKSLQAIVQASSKHSATECGASSDKGPSGVETIHFASVS
jgi:hypothetical protein